MPLAVYIASTTRCWCSRRPSRFGRQAPASSRSGRAAHPSPKGPVVATNALYILLWFGFNSPTRFALDRATKRLRRSVGRWNTQIILGSEGDSAVPKPPFKGVIKLDVRDSVAD